MSQQYKNKYPFLQENDFQRLRQLAKIRVEEKLKRKICMRGCNTQ